MKCAGGGPWGCAGMEGKGRLSWLHPSDYEDAFW